MKITLLMDISSNCEIAATFSATDYHKTVVGLIFIKVHIFVDITI